MQSFFAGACTWQKILPPPRSRLGLLLGDAVDVAAAEGHLPGLDPHDLPVREHLLQLLDGQLVVFIAVLGGDNGPVDDEEITRRC